MSTTLDLRYGSTTIRVVTHARVAEVAAPRFAEPPLGVSALLTAALERPIGSAPLEARVRPGDRVTVIVSDRTRDEPRRELLAAVRARLPSVRLTLAIATGTHGPSGGPASVGLAGVDLAGVTVVDHDGGSPADLVDVGETARATPVRVHRCVVEADLVVATGVIRPHYFAGWGAGAKAVFPGLAESTAARVNHRFKTHPSALPGAVDDNVCRLDMEDAALLAAPRAFLLDGVADGEGAIRGAVAGDLLTAFRTGVDLARPWVTVTAPRSRLIVVEDQAPVTDSLYQACKLVAAVAARLLPGGTIVLVAPCADGIGPVDVVNRAIYEIGLKPRLPTAHRILLVSELADDVVRASFAVPLKSLADAIAGVDELILVRGASKLVVHGVDA